MKHALAIAAAVLVASTTFGVAQGVCRNYGPQAPRDISVKAGENPLNFQIAPPSNKMNLCNIHFHANAEHKGPGFSIQASNASHHGFQCNQTSKLTAAELKVPEGGGC